MCVGKYILIAHDTAKCIHSLPTSSLNTGKNREELSRLFREAVLVWSPSDKKQTIHCVH